MKAHTISTSPLAFAFAFLFASESHGVPLLEFTFDPELEQGNEIVESLGEGHTAEVRFQIRVYRRSSGLSRLFGDRLIAEQSVLYQARRDRLNDRYVVVVDGELERSFANNDELIDFLVVLKDHQISLPAASAGDIYLLCRVQVEPIRLVPPLTLLTFVVPGFRTTTPWLRTDYRRLEL